jgi:hypothetical protein
MDGRGGEIRTHDLLHPKQARIPGYATPRPCCFAPRQSRMQATQNIGDRTPQFNPFSAVQQKSAAEAAPVFDD